MLADIKQTKAAIATITKGETAWPKAHFELTFKLSELVVADKQNIMKFMKTVFAVMGSNCELFAIFSGYWDESLSTKSLGERAEKLGNLFKE